MARVNLQASMGDPLSIMPSLHITAVTPENDCVEVSGLLDRWSDMGKAAWFTLWVSNTEAVTPAATIVNKETGEVSLSIDIKEMHENIRPGASLHWLNSYWSAHHVKMILYGPLVRRDFKLRDAVHFVLGKSRGSEVVGEPLPEGAQQTGIEPGGWDHEHCEICNAHIGVNGFPFGYVYEDCYWLCPECYDRWAVPKSLGFLEQ